MTSVEFIVLTGFLGSGKTTLLRDFLPRPEAVGTAVIVNEAGEIGLDGALLREVENGLNMTMLANGCVCCQLGNDLAETIHGLLDLAPVTRIVLETSGLSKPGPILRQLATVPGLPMRVSVLAIYDALRGPHVIDFSEAAAQWAAAHRIVATRMDALAPERHIEVAPAIAALNPLAEIVALADRGQAVTAAFAPLPPTATLPETGELQAHTRITVRLARPTRAPTYAELATWLDNLAGALGDRLLRLKGVIQLQECGPPVLIQCVGTMFSAPRPFPAGGHQDFLVLIALDLAKDDLLGIHPQDLFHVSPGANPFTPHPRTRFKAERVPSPGKALG